MQLAKDLTMVRYKKAVLFLNSINKINLISHLRLRFGPSKEYLYKIIRKLDLNIVSSQTLEFGRRFFVILIQLLIILQNMDNFFRGIII